jgi:hypothetical protein
MLLLPLTDSLARDAFVAFLDFAGGVGEVEIRRNPSENTMGSQAIVAGARHLLCYITLLGLERYDEWGKLGKHPPTLCSLHLHNRSHVQPI